MKNVIAAVCLLVLPAALVSCSGGKATTTSTPTGPTTPSIVINAPSPVSPANGSTSTGGWPTLTVNNATHTGSVGTLAYRFDIASDANFGSIVLVGNIIETPNQTSYTPTSTQNATNQTTYYWRCTVSDTASNIQGPSSTTQNFVYSDPPSTAARIAAQEGAVLWPGATPTGNMGQARLGDAWNVGVLTSFDGHAFLSPTIDELRVFDLLDRGMSPQQGIDWLNSHGYGTQAVWYPGPAAIGFPFQYMALINGRWDLVLRAGA